MKKANAISPAGKDTVPALEYFPGLYLKEIHTHKSFYTYWHKENYVFNYTLMSVVFVEFFVFKFLYPYPDFFSDSYSYIFAAYRHLDANIWPIGYSKFLIVFHWFTHSGIALNFFQFMFLEVAALYFYHTIVYFYPTGKTTRTLLNIFLFFNPLWLYLANYVTSDAIFVGLSLLWITQLIWIIQKAHWSQVPIQAILFIIAFTFRYNAMYYPLLTAAAFLYSRHKPIVKLAGSVLGPILMVAFILFSREATYKMLGTPQFPPILGGWQWGNNALYIREFVDMDSTRFPSSETAELDGIARTYFRAVPHEYRDLPNYVANFFIRQPEAPLKVYLRAHYDPKSAMENVIAWGKCAPIFSAYGIYVIKAHPWAFVRYFMLLNTKNYFLPPLEKLEIYNLGDDNMDWIAAYWFHFPSAKITSVSKNLQGYILFIYPCLFFLVNLYFLVDLFLYWKRKIYQKAQGVFNRTIILTGGFLLLNFGFSIFANIIVIRYQCFPMIICLAFGLLLTDAREFYTHPVDAPQPISPPTQTELRPSI